MKRFIAAIAVFVTAVAFLPTHTIAASPAKQKVVASIDRQASELIPLSDQIWAFAETALRETRSAALLADPAEAQEFEEKTRDSDFRLYIPDGPPPIPTD